jgi:hypothetical protein
MDQDHARPRGKPVRAASRIAPRLLLLGVGLAAWIVVAATASAAGDLRPLADDYCHAAESAPGFVEAVAFWYQSSIGDVIQVSVTTLFVGLPLANLPLPVASLIPFLFTVIAVASLVLVAALGRSRGDLRSRLFGIAVVVPIGMVAWWGFWWIPAIVDPNPVNPAMALALAATSWQTVNVQYALVPALALIALLVLDSRSRALVRDAVAWPPPTVPCGRSGSAGTSASTRPPGRGSP